MNRAAYYAAHHDARAATRRQLDALYAQDRAGHRAVTWMERETVAPTMRRRFNLPRSRVSEVGVLLTAQRMRRAIFVMNGRYCTQAMVKPRPIPGSAHETIARRKLEAAA